MKIAILFRVAVVVVGHKCRDVSATTFTRADFLDVLDGETAHAVSFHLALAFVKVNDIFTVKGLNDCFLFGAEKSDEVFFGDDVLHSVLFG